MSNDWLDRYEEEKRKRNEEVPRWKARIMDRLKELGVTKVEVEYDGCGDSGCVESLTAYKDGTEMPIDKEVEEDIENFVCDRLPDGWEIDDGGIWYGRFRCGSTKRFGRAQSAIHIHRRYN